MADRDEAGCPPRERLEAFAAGEPADAALAAHLRSRLAPHKRPRHVCYVDRLPHTSAGKLDRGALPAVARGLRALAPD